MVFILEGTQCAAGTSRCMQQRVHFTRGATLDTWEIVLGKNYTNSWLFASALQREEVTDPTFVKFYLNHGLKSQIANIWGVSNMIK
jgi:hypothetical protein